MILYGSKQFSPLIRKILEKKNICTEIISVDWRRWSIFIRKKYFKVIGRQISGGGLFLQCVTCGGRAEGCSDLTCSHLDGCNHSPRDCQCEGLRCAGKVPLGSTRTSFKVDLRSGGRMAQPGWQDRMMPLQTLFDFWERRKPKTRKTDTYGLVPNGALSVAILSARGLPSGWDAAWDAEVRWDAACSQRCPVASFPAAQVT